MRSDGISCVFVNRLNASPCIYLGPGSLPLSRLLIRLCRLRVRDEATTREREIGELIGASAPMSSVLSRQHQCRIGCISRASQSGPASVRLRRGPLLCNPWRQQQLADGCSSSCSTHLRTRLSREAERERAAPAGGGRLRRNVASRAAGELALLGTDVLYFLGATVCVIPLFKYFKLSPVLGFLASGVILHQLGCAPAILRMGCGDASCDSSNIIFPSG